MGEEASQPKKKGNELLVFVLLPQECPSCTKPAVVAKANTLLEQAAGQARENGSWGEGRGHRISGAGGLLPPQCSLTQLRCENGAGSVSSSQQEPRWQRMGHGAAGHAFPHAWQQEIA